MFIVFKFYSIFQRKLEYYNGYIKNAVKFISYQSMFGRSWPGKHLASFTVHYFYNVLLNWPNEKKLHTEVLYFLASVFNSLPFPGFSLKGLNLLFPWFML
jgi:hypothetical protein